MQRTKTIQVSGREWKVIDIDFDWIDPTRTDVPETWDKWLYGITPKELCMGFQCPEDAIAHFLTDVITNNPFGLSKQEIDEIDVDHTGSLLLAYCERTFN